MSTTAPSLDPRVNELLREAARWRLLGRLFECPSEAWRRDVARLAAEIDDDELRAIADEALAHATEGEHHSIFGPGGPAPPREVSYYDSVELGSLMSALTGCYQAFGYQPALDEAPDHVAVEVGFVSYLRLKEAYARASALEEAATIAADAAARFVADHLAGVAEKLAAVLEESGSAHLAHASARLLALTGPRARPRLLPVLPATVGVAEDDFCCGDEPDALPG